MRVQQILDEEGLIELESELRMFYHDFYWFDGYILTTNSDYRELERLTGDIFWRIGGGFLATFPEVYEGGNKS